MPSRPLIGVFDSGVGGLSVWREIIRQLPHHDTIYLADQAHVPYGGRSLEDVRGFCGGITRFFLARSVQAVVVACNTASAAALYALREAFPAVHFVGMEPAVKPAVERSRTSVVAVIATRATFQGELFESLLERYAQDVEVLTRVCPGLVEAVEAGALDDPGTDALLLRCLMPLVDADVDQLVLGCTHYPFLRPAIERLVGDGISVIDPALAVARQTARVVTGLGLEFDQDRRGNHVFFTTGQSAAFEEMLESLAGELTESRSVHRAWWRSGELVT